VFDLSSKGNHRSDFGFFPPKDGGGQRVRDARMATVSFRLRCFPALAALLLFAALPTHALSGSASKAAAQAGAILFRDKGCEHCHGLGGTGGKKAPALTGLRKDKLWPPAKITNQILNGGQKMPPFGDSLTDAEIAQVVAYLRAKHRPLPPPATAPPAQTPAQ
jgi:mono/diheme cytochrome c family protein